MSAEKERRDERQIVKQVQREVRKEKRKRQGTRWTHSPNMVGSSVAVLYILEYIQL